MHHTSYMATSEEKQIDSYAFENGMINVFLREFSGGQSSSDELQGKT